jgi:hypothetical protein
MYWDEHHYGDSHDDMDCEERVVKGICSDFEMLNDDEEHCEWTIMYNSCPEKEIFTCRSFGIVDGHMDVYNCLEDFMDYDFWIEFREEDWWNRPENLVHMDLKFYWDNYHMDNNDDHEDCEWISVELRCTDFEKGQQDYRDYGTDCDMYLSYSPCRHDYFICEQTAPDSDGEMRTDDCTYYFLEFDFWSEIR